MIVLSRTKRTEDDWMVDYQVDGRTVAVVAYDRHLDAEECRYINSIEGGQTMQGKMKFAKLVRRSRPRCSSP